MTPPRNNSPVDGHVGSVARSGCEQGWRDGAAPTGRCG